MRQTSVLRTFSMSLLPAILLLPIKGAAENDDPAKFGVVSPEMRKCFAETIPSPECKTGNTETEDSKGTKLGPFRISGVGHIGIGYDGDRIVPEHGLEITFELGGQTDGGLSIGSRADLPISNE